LIAVLAVMIHLLDGGVGPISEPAVRKAIRWGGYLRSHAKRIYGSSQSKGDGAATVIAAKIGSGKLSDGFTARDIKRNGWRGLARDDQVELGLQVLVDLGWLRADETTGAQRPTTKYFINPRVRDRA